MAWFRKSPDPLRDRERALAQEMTALQSQIRELSTKLNHPAGQPKLRSTALPDGAQAAPAPASREPEFVEFHSPPLSKTDPLGAWDGTAPELGVRQEAPLSLWEKIVHQFRGPTATNPKLVNYLAAGSIQGLRPLRYEKRIARRRFIFLFLFLLFVLWIIVSMIWHR